MMPFIARERWLPPDNTFLPPAPFPNINNSLSPTSEVPTLLPSHLSMMLDTQETPSDSKGVVITTSASEFTTFEELATRVLSDTSLARQHHDFLYSDMPPDWGEKAFDRLNEAEWPFR